MVEFHILAFIDGFCVDLDLFSAAHGIFSILGLPSVEVLARVWRDIAPQRLEFVPLARCSVMSYQMASG